MDWSRTKSFLIISLIFTNLVLGYFYYVDQTKTTQAGGEQFGLENIEALLNKKNILLKTDANISVPNVVGIDVAFETYDMSNLASKFFDTYNLSGLASNILGTSSQYQKFSDEHYYDENFDLKVLNEKFLEFELKDYDSLKVDDSIGEEAKYYSDRFVQYVGFMTDETKYGNIIKEDNYYKVEYVQVANDKQIMDSKMVVKVSNKQVIGFSRIWLNTKNENIAENKFKDVGNALYTFMEKVYIDYPGRVDKIMIEDISVGYRLINSNSRVEISNISSGTADPYWIIKTNKGTYMIEALKN